MKYLHCSSLYSKFGNFISRRIDGQNIPHTKIKIYISIASKLIAQTHTHTHTLQKTLPLSHYNENIAIKKNRSCV